MAMLIQVDALPSAQRHCAPMHRDGKMGLGQRGAHVGRHVVRAFQAVGEERVAILKDPLNKSNMVATGYCGMPG